MTALMKQNGHSLDDESLRTLLCEVEAVLNSCPLSLLPLTPSTLLTGKSKLILPPPGKFQREDVYCKRRWRRVQCERVLEQVEQRIFTEPTSKTKVDTPEKKLH